MEPPEPSLVEVGNLDSSVNGKADPHLWLKEQLKDQASPGDLEPGGAIVRKLGLAVHLSRPVKVGK